MPTSATAYFPFDAGAGASITEDQWRKMARWFMLPGIFPLLNNLKPFGDSTGMQAKVDTGAAWVQGAYGEWTSGITILGIAAAGGIAGGQERWDRIIVRNDFVNNRVELDVLTGTPAAPTAALPALTQSSSVWEISIAEIGPITNATTTITAAMVKDRRSAAISPYTVDELTLRAAAASVTLPQSGSIPDIFDVLIVEWQARGDTAASSALLRLRLNGDTGANYDAEEQAANGAGTSGTERDLAATSASVGDLSAATAPAGQAGAGQIWIPNYRGPWRKNIDAQCGYKTGDATGNQFTVEHGSTWRSTAAVTSVTVFPATGNFAADSRFKLYAI